MKCLFIIPAIVFASGNLFFSIPPADPFVDPTGTYILKGMIKKDKILGHYGEIRVKLLGPKKVAMCFYISKGYPGYESGAIIDTLTYRDNEMVYDPPTDTACSIIFSFTKKMAEIHQAYSIPNAGCGFGNGVLISAYFEKSSAEIPIIQNLSAHGVAP